MLAALTKNGKADERKKVLQRGGGSHGEYVYEAIKNQILSGRIPPGARLVESQLAEQLNLSRTPVREALGWLAAEQLITRNASGSLIVTVPRESDVEEIYLIREVLEGLAARLAARRMSEAELMMVETTVERMREAAKDNNSALFNSTNIAFHRQIYEATGNRRLQRMGRELADFVQLISQIPMRLPKRPDEILGEHNEILEALRSHSAEDAEAAARAHAAKAREVAIRALAADHLADIDAESGTAAESAAKR